MGARARWAGAVGWVAGPGLVVQTDLPTLVGAGTPALRELQQLQRVTGVSGELDVLVHGREVTTPSTLAWMSRFQTSVLARYGPRARASCDTAILCPGLSAPDLFRAGGGGQPTAVTISDTLATVPRYFTGAVVSTDRRAAIIAFGIRLMPLREQERVIDDLRARLDPPAGTSAELAGLPVLAADASGALSSPTRRLLSTLAALFVVTLALLIAFRDVRRALIPIVPIACAGGWSGLVLSVLRVSLNPMSATLGALVIAVSTEFSVLLAERYRQERSAGASAPDALAAAYRRTGAAVLASGFTVIAAFAVLIASDIPLLRNFGVMTVVDLTVSLAGVLLVLPAVLAVAEPGAHAPDRRAADAIPSQHGRRRAPAQVG